MTLFNLHIDLVMATCTMSMGYVTPSLFRRNTGYFLVILNTLIIICGGFLLLQFMNPLVAVFSFLFGVTVYKSATTQFNDVFTNNDTDTSYSDKQRPKYPPNYTVWTDEEREEELNRRREWVNNSGTKEEASESRNGGKSKTIYDVLGVEEGCTLDDIKKAKRRLVAYFHPDKLQHLPESRRKDAENELKAILSAYDELLRKFK